MTILVKLLFLFAYGWFGVFLILAAAGLKPRVFALPERLTVLIFTVLAGAALFRFSQHGFIFLACVLCATALIAFRDRTRQSTKALVATIAVVISSLSLAWWLILPNQISGWWRVALYSVAVWSLLKGFSRRKSQATESGEKVLPFILASVFSIAGFLVMADMTPYTPGSQPLVVLAHHHGAYIGSALHVLAGLVPFYDVPLQYGLGPTLAIAAACRTSGCWAGLDFLTIATTLFMGLAILAMALAGSRYRGAAWRVAAFATIFAAVFLWPGLPDLGSIAAATPSVGGLRFLPVTAVAFFLFFGHPRLAAGIFIPAVLWSPEAAFMTVAVFGIHETARLGFARAALKTVGLTTGSYTVLALVHRLIYGVWMQPEVMAEYILHVPGPLPIDPFSDVLLLSATFALAGWLVYRRRPDDHRDNEVFRRDLLAGSLLFVATSYYLGRSHPNAVCNLMPFLTLVALRAVGSDGETRAPGVSPALSRMTMGGLAAATAAIVLAPWNYMPFGQFFPTHPGAVVEAIAALDPDINEIRARIVNPEHLGISDFALSRNRNPAETTVWTPMDPESLWSFVPDDRRKLYIRRSAERLRRSGWIIVQGDPARILDDFKVAYNITQQTVYESGRGPAPSTYTVARLTPLGIPALTSRK